MPKMREVRGMDTGNRFCGPAALSIITGLSTSRCAGLVNEIRRKPSYMAVNAVWTDEMVKTLESIDYEVEEIPKNKLGSIYWMLSTIKENGMYLTCLKTHFVVLEIDGQNRTLCDNHTRTPIRAGNSARLSQNVESMFRIYKDQGKEILEGLEAWGL